MTRISDEDWMKLRSWSYLYRTRREILKEFPDFWKVKIKKKHWDVIEKVLWNGCRVLDVGSSDRRMEAQLKEKGYPDIYYRSMDIDREHFHDYYSLEGIEEQFDVIFLFEVIEHLEFEDGMMLLNAIHDLLSDEGFLILTTPNVFHPNRYWEYSHKVSYRYDELGGILLALGFHVRQVYRIYNDPFLKRFFRVHVAAPLHAYLSVDFAKSILVVAQKAKRMAEDPPTEGA
jgi:2-polyprenyl-3-methyl-5-hydroxy-6-metoxy-1,4-benzoquinol methylase